VHLLSVEVVEKILIKSVGMMFGKLVADLKYRDAVAESLIAECLTTVNSVCLPWWNVLTGRKSNKRSLRLLLDSKFSYLTLL